MIRVQYLFLLFALLHSRTDSYRILCVYTFPARSHHVVFNVLTNELAKRGHEMVVITTHPQKNNANITEIEVPKVGEVWIETIKSSPVSKILKRGVKWMVDMINTNNARLMVDMAEEVLSDPAVKALISDKKQNFDLIIAESLYDYPLIFTEIFDAPFIWFSSFTGIANNFKTMGAPTSHPFLYPNVYKNRFNNLTVTEKIYELYLEARLAYIACAGETMEDELVKKHFGRDAPSLASLKDKVDLLFVNTNPIFFGNRPVPPGVIHLGGLHLEPVKALPEDLKFYLDNSKRGVVYMSFGTNVNPKAMDSDLFESFIQTIEILPYDFLWKFDGELPKKPKNLKIAKWWPQRDLLSHPNIKAFVTQAGLQSTDEAIDSGVPLIGIPLLAEQGFNAARYVKLGIGVSIDIAVMTTEDLVGAIRTVVEDKSFKKNIVELGNRIRDQPETPLQRAVWWTEHLLRHGGAKHLRSPQANISWSKYLILDVVAFVATGVTIAVLIVCYAVKLVFSFGKKGKVKAKVN